MENSKKVVVQKSPQHELCEKRVLNCLDKNIVVKHILTEIESMGCKLPKGFFKCGPCNNSNISGGFNVQSNDKAKFVPSILMCEDNSIPFTDTFESTIVHELV